jgi:phospholipid/cholesterol/gamma-HCH transport system substrate-binding protein
VTGRFPGLKFGAFAIVCVLAATWTMTVTGGLRLLASTHTLSVELPDAAGLVVGDAVKIAGDEVGRVRSMRLVDTIAVAEIDLDDDVPITDTWQAGVRWRNLLGQRFLYLYPAPGGMPLTDGATIPADRIRRSADLARVLDDLGPLLTALDPGQVNTVVAALDTALTGHTDEVRDLVSDLGSLTTALADRDAQIATLTDNAAAVLSAYAERDEEIRDLLTDSADIATTLAERDDVLVGAITDIGALQSELGRLLTANDAHIRGSTRSLATTSATIGANRDELAQAVATLPQGLATYLLISRWGQWFNIRTVAVQAQRDGEILFCRMESGGACADPNGGAGTPREPTAPQPATTPSAVDLSPTRLPVTAPFAGALPAGALPAEALRAGTGASAGEATP